jgi:uncharacterized 2Fe-2S/4Fe-4S cluster protein (DUF4445 family)
MSDLVRIELEPLGQVLEIKRGTPLQDVLFDYGVEFPCGGQGDCRGCRVKLLSGALPVTPDEALILTPQEIDEGWRLACRNHAEADLRLEIAQWETVILEDARRFEFTPREGLGIAVDLGTTTLVAQLVDLSTGNVLGVRTGLNPQAAWGADIMSRVESALRSGNGARLTGAIRAKLGEMASELVASARADARVREVTVVGNTVMHNLFCGIDVEPLSHVPFHPARDGLELFAPAELGWQLDSGAQLRFLPCLGGFVGSDILAGILATRMHESDKLLCLIDLGTNGEIVVGNRERMICASTAAGPAFEGGRISSGMRAATGAISEVRLEDSRLRCHVIGGGPPRGICGSGLVDAVAAGLQLGVVASNGRLNAGNGPWTLAPPVSLTQADVRELQLAKGAIAAGVRILLRHWGASSGDIARLHLAGAFGNYINRSSARRIGLIDFPEDKIEPAGNTALLGAKLALFAGDGKSDFADLCRRVEHISLAEDAEFHQIYAEEMRFP